MLAIVGWFVVQDQEISPKTRDSIRRGLEFVTRAQGRDGSWGENNRAAKTALACLAMMASGSTLEKGPYAPHLRKGLAYILECGRRRRGHLTDWKTTDWSDTHNHGYGLLFLGLVHGTIREKDLASDVREMIELAIERSLKSQTDSGGWGYSITIKNHNEMKDEGSCTITQIAALRACRDAGFHVPKEPIEKAVEYIVKCAYKGGFYYALEYQGKPLVRLGDSGFNPESMPRFAITAAAVSVLNAYGAPGDARSVHGKLIREGLEYLLDFIPRKKRTWDDYDFYYYGNFYATLAMMAEGGERWRTYWPVVRDELLARQGQRGAWEDEKRWGQADEHIDTAFALLVLQAPYRLLPIYVE